MHRVELKVIGSYVAFSYSPCS